MTGMRAKAFSGTPGMPEADLSGQRSPCLTDAGRSSSPRHKRPAEDQINLIRSAKPGSGSIAAQERLGEDETGYESGGPTKNTVNFCRWPEMAGVGGKRTAVENLLFQMVRGNLSHRHPSP